MKYIFKNSCIGVSIFKQAGAAPTITLVSVADITDSTANVNVSIADGDDVSKTGVEIDIDATFSNPTIYEENGAVNNIAVDNLTAETTYYVRAYVIWGGQTIYSSNSLSFTTEQGSLLPPELQACEWLQTDGNCFIEPNDNVFLASGINYLHIKYTINSGGNSAIFGIISPTPRKFFCIQLISNKYAFSMQCIVDDRWTSNISANTEVEAEWSKVNNTLIVNGTTHSLSYNYEEINYYVKIFGIMILPSTRVKANNGSKIWYVETNTFKLLSCYVKSGQTFTDNKGNVCGAGTCGMYDVVNNVFYTNDGTGTFSHGGDINI